MAAPFWFKLTALLLIAMVVYCIFAPTVTADEFRFTCKTYLVEEMGTNAQRDRLIDEASRRSAIRDGTLEAHDRTVAYCEAVEAQRRLARIDERLADYAIEVAVSERDER
jgi:hypothetical protein